ncbi:MAG: phosphoglucosamine mutase [Acidobacteria bacterium]|nr:phosphoglucosamine mutase [Acidobacteriota bacterium]
MSKREHLLKIGVSGIRGVVGEFLTPALACAFAQAFGTYTGRGRVILGRDTRSSGPMLEHAVTCGLLSAGCDVVQVGVLPTPTIQMYVAATGALGGIALTASHNPPEYNALKLFNEQGQFFNHYERGELIDLFHQGEFTDAGNFGLGSISQEYSTPARMHFDRVLKCVNRDRIRQRNFHAAIDAVNGAGSILTPHFLEQELGCRLEAISVDPTQPFPREAEPTPQSLGDLKELMKRTGAEIGFAQDPDGDRLAVAKPDGTLLDNDEVLALVVDAVLSRMPGNVVVNLTSSSVIDEVAAWHGCKVFRSAVGEANVVERMLAHKAVIGGEGSNGGIIFPTVHYCRDSYTGMAFLLDRMAETGLGITELAARLPKFYRVSTKVPFQHGRLAGIIQATEARFPDAKADRTDGLKLIWPDGAWLHVRGSNTEPLMRLSVESRDAERTQVLMKAGTDILGS